MAMVEKPDSKQRQRHAPTLSDVSAPEAQTQATVPSSGPAKPDPLPAATMPADALSSIAVPPLCKRVGPYEVQEEIARGGMGVVFLARDSRTDQYVALKMLRGGVLSDPENFFRFQREARVQASVQHRHILPVLEAGEYEGEQYFTMPFVSGGTLGRRLAEYVGRPAKVVPLMEKVARAVDHAHQQGILHRDLKPSNILLDEADEPLVSDFGVARPADPTLRLTRTNEAVGTPAYMAPEQTGIESPHKITGRTDVWSLGVMLYELLTGMLPFPGANSSEVFEKVRNHEPPPLRRFRSSLDPALQRIVLRCLEKDPVYRYASAAALADDLAKWQSGEEIAATPVPLTVRWKRTVRRWGQGRRTGWVLMGFLAALVLGWAWWSRHKDPPEQPIPDGQAKAAAYWNSIKTALSQGKSVTLIGPLGRPQFLGRNVGGYLEEMSTPLQTNVPFFFKAKSAYRVELLPPGNLPQRYRLRLELSFEDTEGIVGIYALYHRTHMTQDRIADTFVTVTIGNHGSVVPRYRDSRWHSLCYLWGHFQPIANWRDGLTEFSWNANNPVAPTPDLMDEPRNWRELTMEVRPEEVKIWLDGAYLFKAKKNVIFPGAENNLSKSPPFSPDEAPAAFTPDGGLGLFVHSNRMLARNFIIEPLSE